VDYSGLASELLRRARVILPPWFPNGRFQGNEFVVGSLAGEAGESLKINSGTGRWADFAGDPKGGDLISLYAAREGIRNAEAARRLAKQIGFNLSPNDSPKYSTNGNGSKPEPKIVKPPVGTPPPSMYHGLHGKPSRSWRYADSDGELLSYVARYDTPGGKQFSPWSWDRNSARYVAKAWPAPRPLYGLDILAVRPEASSIVVEGEKAADAARAIVGGTYVVVTWPGGAGGWRQGDWAPLSGRKVLLWPDADRHTVCSEEAGKYGVEVGGVLPYDKQPGPRAMAGIAAILSVICPEVKIIDVGIDLDRADGWDAADALEDGWNLEAFETWAAPRAKVFQPTPKVDPDSAGLGGGPNRERPEINAGDSDLPSVTNSAWQAIQQANKPPFLFRHGGRAVRIESDDDDAPIIRELAENRVRHVLGRVAKWIVFKTGKKEIQKFDALPPLHVVKDILATPNMPLPILARIVQAPVFASDGTLQTAPGYHKASRTYHAPANGFVLPEIADVPSTQDIARARVLIVGELLGDFPFVTDAERAHAVALMLHPFTRDLIDGPTPLHLHEAPSAGTGKGLLVNVLTCPATGQPASVMTAGRDEEEWRKRITSKLRTAPTFVLIDNVQHRIDSAQLAAAITAPVWEDRILGHSTPSKTDLSFARAFDTRTC
jgi:hypothetical protein